MTWQCKLFIIGALMFGTFVGYNIGKIEWTHTDCYDVAGKHVDYTAWLSVRNGTYRCFWIEDKYPHRVRQQGVIDVK